MTARSRKLPKFTVVIKGVPTHRNLPYKEAEQVFRAAQEEFGEDAVRFVAAKETS